MWKFLVPEAPRPTPDHVDPATLNQNVLRAALRDDFNVSVGARRQRPDGASFNMSVTEMRDVYARLSEQSANYEKLQTHHETSGVAGQQVPNVCVCFWQAPTRPGKSPCASAPENFMQGMLTHT